MDTLTPILRRERGTRTAARPAAKPVVETPVAEQVAQLQAVLDDPALVGWHDDARREMAKLTAVNTLAA